MATAYLSRRRYKPSVVAFDALAQDLAERVAHEIPGLNCCYEDGDGIVTLCIDGPPQAIAQFVRDYYNLTGLSRIVIDLLPGEDPTELHNAVKSLPTCEIVQI